MPSFRLAALAVALALLGWGAAAQVAQTHGGKATPAPPVNHLIVDLNFASNTFTGCASLTSCLSVTRTTAETCKSSAGAITYQTSGNACITTAGLAVWQASTNILIHSAQDSGWTQNTLASANLDATPPDGVANTATTMTDNSTNLAHYYQSPNVTVVSGTTYVSSCFVNPGTLGFVQLTQANGIQSSNGYANFNLTTGAVTVGGVGNTALAAEAYSGGWWRVATRWNASASASGGIFVAMAQSAAATRLLAYVGSGSTIQVWGCQVEASLYQTPYIPTTTASVTRNIDNIAVAGSSLLETTLNAATGTIVANTSAEEGRLAVAATAATIVDSNGTVFLGKTTTQTGTTAVGATLSTATTGTWTGTNDLGLAWDAAGGVIQLNSGTQATDATARTPATTFHLGATSGATAPFNGYITRLRAYDDKETTPQ